MVSIERVSNIPKRFTIGSHWSKSLQLSQQLHYLHIHLNILFLQFQLLLAQLANVLFLLLHFALHYSNFMDLLVSIKRNWPSLLLLVFLLHYVHFLYGHCHSFLKWIFLLQYPWYFSLMAILVLLDLSKL